MLFFDILGLLFVTWKSVGPCDEIEDKRSVWTDFVSNQPSNVCFIPNLNSFSVSYTHLTLPTNSLV